jgi:hypothetical protein
MGVLDPTKVTRTALQNAASVAGLMLTTDCMVAELVEDKPAGGMPGMGGMGGMGAFAFGRRCDSSPYYSYCLRNRAWPERAILASRLTRKARFGGPFLLMRSNAALPY